MSDKNYKKGDIVVFERVPQGVRSQTYLITGIVEEDGLTEQGNVKVEYANPIPWMSGLINAPHESINFGDTSSTITTQSIVSHYRPTEDNG